MMFAREKINFPGHFAGETFFEPTDHGIVITVIMFSRQAKLGSHKYHTPHNHQPTHISERKRSKWLIVI